MKGSWPKTRPDLPEAYRKIYFEHYKKNRAGASPASFLSERMERWLHRKVAADSQDGLKRPTLEIGAGTLNHLAYETNTPYDVVEPLKEFYEGSPLIARVRRIYDDIAEIPSQEKYERIISIATFEHVLDLPTVVAHACLHLAPNGSLRASLPNEGGSVWRLAYMLSTGIEFRLKYGLDYSVFMKHEHVNTAAEVEQVLRHFFAKVERAWLGLTPGLSLYRFYACSQPRKEAARAHLERFT
jgi:hypothetical protein